MKRLLILLSLFMCFAAQATPACKVNKYLKSVEGQEKFASLVERSKSLALSKLEELAIDENKVSIKATYPKDIKHFTSSLSISMKAKNLHAEGTSFTVNKVIRDDDCGLEIVIFNGRLLNKEGGKDFGSLGRVKEFVRLN